MDKVNSIGQQVRAVKSDGGDIKAVLAELGAAKKTLEGLVRPQMEAATAAGNTELREALMPAFEKVMTKGERKKRAKELKARDAAAGGGGSAKAAAAADKGGKKGGKKGDKKQSNAKNAKNNKKTKKQKGKNAKKAPANAAVASTVQMYEDPKLSKTQLFLDIEPRHISDGTLRCCIAAGLRSGLQLVPRLVQQGQGNDVIIISPCICYIISYHNIV